MIKEYLKINFNIDKYILELCESMEMEIQAKFKDIDEIAEYNQLKVLKAMQINKLSDSHFGSSTGYGYNDIGRDTLEKIYAEIFNAESALVRPQIISGTHAITTALFGNLRYGDELVSPTGKPYNTLESVIGIRPAKGSLMEHGINYKQVDLKPDGELDYEAISKTISAKTKMVAIQRSKGYEWRPSLNTEQIIELIKFIKSINKDIICMVDNCYGEFVEAYEPSEVADLTVGSLIKNPGGGLAPVGGYIVGKEEYVENAANRLTSPGLGKEVGPMLGITGALAQGLFLAPQVVASSIKGAVFAAKIFESLGFDVLPSFNAKRADIVQAINMKNSENVIKFCQGIQKAAPVDSFVLPEPWAMPGYDSEVIMAAGAFVQGSSIELSADAPIKEPYSVFLQGGLTWFHAKAGIIIAVDNMYKADRIPKCINFW